MQVCKKGRGFDLPEFTVKGSNRSVSMQFFAVQVCNYASFQLCKYASMQVCKYAWRVESLICLNPRWRAATGLATFHRRQAAKTHKNINYLLEPKVNQNKNPVNVKKLQPKLFNPKKLFFVVCTLN
jgi:hypothetical protein